MSKYLPRFVRHAETVMKYLERNQTARSIDLTNLGIDKSYLSAFIPILIEDGCISRKRENGGYTYTFIKPLPKKEDGEIPKHEMQELFHVFVTKSIKAYE